MKGVALVVLCCLLALACGLGRAESAGEAAGEGRALALAARQAYGTGDFAAAAEAFARAHAVAPNLASAAFCLDAALAARLAGQPGRAAFWLRRAGLAAPGDPETTAALAAAGFDAGDVFAGPWFLSGWLPARSLWLTALWANACFWLSLAAGRLFGRPVPRPAALAAGLAVTLLWLAVGWAGLVGEWWPRAVVLGEVPAASAPEDGAEPLGRFAAGELVAVGGERSGRLLVRAPDGRAGWIPREAAAVLRP